MILASGSLLGKALGALLEPLGSLLGRLGTILGFLERSWVVLGALGTSWGPLRAEGSNSRLVFPFLGPSRGRIGALLGHSWAIFGASWAVLKPFWTVLGLSGGPLGPSWAGLWSLVVRLGASEARKSENPKNIEKQNENQ